MTPVKIHVPEDLGGELRVLPESRYAATAQDVFIGLSQAKQPKVTVKWVITSEPYDIPQESLAGEESTIGETVLDSYSLQPQALWRLNSLYKELTGERLPQGEYSEEEFLGLLKEAIVGQEVILSLESDMGAGQERSKVAKVVKA
jgi:hypothetical protein